MSEEVVEYTSEDQLDSDDEELKARGWNVWWNSSTRICSVAVNPPGAVHHRFGPSSWDACWAWIGRSCNPAGGVNKC